MSVEKAIEHNKEHRKEYTGQRCRKLLDIIEK